MWLALLTFVLLGCFLLWTRAWQRGSRFAVGLGLGGLLVLVVVPAVRSIAASGHIPVWAPALPFALIALTLFGFGALAWRWGDD